MTRANALHALGRHHEIVADMGELQKTFQNDKQVEHWKKEKLKNKLKLLMILISIYLVIIIMVAV